MIFSKHELAFRLIDVLKIDNRNVHMVNRNRHFGAISYRVHSDAQIEYREKKIRMSDCTVSYFPHDINYIVSTAQIAKPTQLRRIGFPAAIRMISAAS